MDLEGFHITTGILLQGVMIFAALDAILLPLIARLIKPDLFRGFKWVLVVISGLTWFLIWKTVLTFFWDSAYQFVFPGWGRVWLPYLFGLLMATVSLLFWWLAGQRSRNPIVVFCLLTGVWGILTHTWAIHQGILSKPPLLQGASPLAALLLAFFEYISYWCIISLVSAGVYWTGSKISPKRKINNSI